MRGKVVALVSGGVDSGAMLMRYAFDIAVFVDYGQPARDQELRAAEAITTHCDVPLVVLTVRGVPLGDLGTAEDYGVMCARNMMLISLAATLAGEKGEVVFGAAPHDDTHYPDCRPEFIDAADDIMRRTYGVRVSASRLDRSSAVKSVPVGMSWSCYLPGPEPCGQCASCKQDLPR